MKLSSLMAAACAALSIAGAEAVANVAATQLEVRASNPFAQPSALPFQLPPFDRITNADFQPAFEAGMAEQKNEVAAIAHNPAPASFDNTIVALERSGQMLTRVEIAFDNLTSSNTNDELDRIEAAFAPKLSAHQDSIYLNAGLYARIRTVYAARAKLSLDAESERLLTRYHTLFVRAGAELSDADKMQLESFNERLSTLTTQFKQNVLKASKAAAVVVDDLADLDGLSAGQIAATAERAKARGLHDKWLIAIDNTTGQPLLAQLRNRHLRERIFKASVARGNGGEGDNTGIIAEIVRLRAERAVLLGFPTHAAYVLADETAHSTEAVNRILREIGVPAVAKAHREAADMQQLIDAQARVQGNKPCKLEAWDWAFYSEQVRKARYDYDESQVRPYFELNHVLEDGVFYVANQLYGLTFKQRNDLPVYQSDVRVFEVFDADGSPLGLFLADFFARPNKQGGAWMNNFVAQSRLLGRKAVVANHLNIAKPPDGEPALLTFDEAVTMFHEFGHALHGLLSNARYPLLSGTRVPRDFVEYPSQFNEMWADNPVVLAHYARHYQTGAPMPQALLAKVLAAQKFNQGFATTEYLAAAMLDQSWHQIPASRAPAAAGVLDFEQAALEADGVGLAAVPPRYHSPYFSHIFAGGYSAGYYAYIWTAVLAADTQQWFGLHGGLSRANGDLMRAKILSRGGTVDAGQLFREFYGAEPDVKPLLERRGLAVAGAT